ncbi:unnamed protein product [Ceutorhynchus assimilis]|uniref:Uncharacterized protein n=1 Tax=Ceutorhynchus assimilis TaxID=467358 RepID=A0A9N9MGX7_9CUCU|nr:unnamed protein product [Ceutorhynchus assimilis]
MNRRDAIIIHRLRIGLTRATHCYLMENGDPHLCEFCAGILTVDHIISECLQYTENRNNLNIGANYGENFSHTKIIKMLQYVKDINMYSQI